MNKPPYQAKPACASLRRPMALRRLLFLDGADGALVGAGAAADADISIDDVLVFAFGNSLDGALIGASAALDTSVSDIKSHDVTSINMLLVITLSILT